jgi:hypothetical protein
MKEDPQVATGDLSFINSSVVILMEIPVHERSRISNLSIAVFPPYVEHRTGKV